MENKFKIAVLGPIPHDHIITYKNETIEKYGCVLSPVAALSALSGEDSVIYPVSHVRRKDEPEIKQNLLELKCVGVGYSDVLQVADIVVSNVKDIFVEGLLSRSST